MCINYLPPSRRQLVEHFGIEAPEEDWENETWQDYTAPVMIDTGTGPFTFLASYGFVPKRHMPGKLRLTTMNARSETIAELNTYRSAWHHSQLCLIPMQEFYEPCYESGKAVRHRIGMADGQPFAVAGIWRSWNEPDGKPSYSFTQITINADQHAIMRRTHKPEDEKRCLVIVPQEEYGNWLSCRQPEMARRWLANYPADKMLLEPKPLPVMQKPVDMPNLSLFD